jgi:hypothetical protein
MIIYLGTHEPLVPMLQTDFCKKRAAFIYSLSQLITLQGTFENVRMARGFSRAYQSTSQSCLTSRDNDLCIVSASI